MVDSSNIFVEYKTDYLLKVSVPALGRGTKILADKLAADKHYNTLTANSHTVKDRHYYIYTGSELYNKEQVINILNKNNINVNDPTLRDIGNYICQISYNSAKSFWESKTEEEIEALLINYISQIKNL